MKHAFTLEYWLDDDWYVGRLKEIPNVFSQGMDLAELEENIREVYELMFATEEPATASAQTYTKSLEVEI